MCASRVRLPQEVSTHPEVRDELCDNFVVRRSYIWFFTTPNLWVPVMQIFSDFLTWIYNQFRIFPSIPVDEMRLPLARLARGPIHRHNATLDTRKKI